MWSYSTSSPVLSVAQTFQARITAGPRYTLGVGASLGSQREATKDLMC